MRCFSLSEKQRDTQRYKQGRRRGKGMLCERAAGATEQRGEQSLGSKLSH